MSIIDDFKAINEAVRKHSDRILDWYPSSNKEELCNKEPMGRYRIKQSASGLMWMVVRDRTGVVIAKDFKSYQDAWDWVKGFGTVVAIENVHILLAG